MGDRWRGTEGRVAVHNVDRGLLAQSGHNTDLLSGGVVWEEELLFTIWIEGFLLTSGNLCWLVKWGGGGGGGGGGAGGGGGRGRVAIHSVDTGLLAHS